MKVINATTIGKLIEAHFEHDEEKFRSYANFIAECYEEEGEDIKAKIIHSKLDGTYKNKSKVELDFLNGASVCEKIKKLRISNDLSQKELGEILGTSQQNIARYENGENTPKVEQLKKFADVFGVPLIFLVGD